MKVNFTYRNKWENCLQEGDERDLGDTFFKLGSNPGANLLNYLILAIVGIAVFTSIFKAKKGHRVPLGILLFAVFAIIAWQLIGGPMSLGVTVSPGRLEIKNSLFTGPFTVEKADVEELKIVDWKEEEEFFPTKIVGTAVGSYKTGKFKLKNGSDAKVLVVSSKVMVIRMADHYVLLSPENFDEFVSVVNRSFLPVENIP